MNNVFLDLNVIRVGKEIYKESEQSFNRKEIDEMNKQLYNAWGRTVEQKNNILKEIEMKTCEEQVNYMKKIIKERIEDKFKLLNSTLTNMNIDNLSVENMKDILMYNNILKSAPCFVCVRPVDDCVFYNGRNYLLLTSKNTVDDLIANVIMKSMNYDYKENYREYYASFKLYNVNIEQVEFVVFKNEKDWYTFERIDFPKLREEFEQKN